MSDNKGYQVPRDSNSPEATATAEAPEQKTHNYKGNSGESGSSHSQPATLPGQGERKKREVKADASVTAGRRVTDKSVRTWDKPDTLSREFAARNPNKFGTINRDQGRASSYSLTLGCTTQA